MLSNWRPVLCGALEEIARQTISIAIDDAVQDAVQIDADRHSPLWPGPIKHPFGHN